MLPDATAVAYNPVMDTFSRSRPHPWHGLSAGPEPPRRVHAFIEITPFDFVKYELDKESGYLRVDRPQRTSSLPPVLYGFVPRTFAGTRVGGLMAGATSGDGDPLDICVLSERNVTKSEVLITARVVGGIPMLDDGHADDKIVAVLENDPLWAEIEDIAAVPQPFVERLSHYFATYKLIPGVDARVSVGPAYGRDHAEAVIRAALDDYRERFEG
jgi:inorganic pyrophosphatase